MKEKLSALMDGELDDRSAAEVLQALGSDREAVRTWRTYQLVSDALRENRGAEVKRRAQAMAI